MTQAKTITRERKVERQDKLTKESKQVTVTPFGWKA
jgi:hypothetical protein